MWWWFDSGCGKYERCFLSIITLKRNIGIPFYIVIRILWLSQPFMLCLLKDDLNMLLVNWFKFGMFAYDEVQCGFHT